MKWLELIEKVPQKVPFTMEQLSIYFPSNNYKSISQNIYNWCQKDKIIKLRRNLYIINSSDINSMYIANKLYEPSYISLEYAMSFYQLIPDVAFQPTSITMMKTKQFKNKLGTFFYRNLKKELYFGFKYYENVLIAEREKCLLDYFYLNLSKVYFQKQYLEHLRLQNLEKLNWKKIKIYLKTFNVKKLSNFVNFVISTYEEYY